MKVALSCLFRNALDNHPRDTGSQFQELNPIGTPLADHDDFAVICPIVVTDLRSWSRGDNTRLDRLYPHSMWGMCQKKKTKFARKILALTVINHYSALQMVSCHSWDIEKFGKLHTSTDVSSVK